ncbi:kinesin-like protein KIF9 isoform X2 [Myripristis murdjan]|uniref:kinesin-like protein KIF9 isoform X2 n=1 Tax=Myripristis murdjan TaxID=586833 RepID=UPI00117614EA|nr:kinesin-like protein KIF9 isoform X2 [Myripristis murdjan]
MKSVSSKVEVFVRIRPTAHFAQNLIEYPPDGQTVNIHNRKDPRNLALNNQPSSWSFQLDGVLHHVSQEEVYARVGRRAVLGALEGYNGTVMCFGQTGAGKTYTMTGSTESYKQRGIIPRALQEVFQQVEKRCEYTFSVHLSYLEIYNETLVDLLSSPRGSSDPPARGMVVMEEPGRGVFIRGLTLHPVHSEGEALNLLFEGEMNRIIGAHALNKNSSRSHCIFTVHIESRSRTLSDAKYVTSKLNLVDLAGSERLGKTGSAGQGLKEAMYINKSLSFLEQAILALADRRRDHVPFRQTKLTYALKDALGGNCNTVLVANIYGEAAQIEETLSTLRFGSRMKRVQTHPTVNEHIDPAAQIKKLEKEVQMLKEELSIYHGLAVRPSNVYEPLSDAQVAEIQSQIISIRQLQEVFAQFKLAVEEQAAKVKAQLCQTYNLVEKKQNARSAGVKADSTDSMVETEDGAGVQRHAGPGKSKAKKYRDAITARQGKKQGAGSPVTVMPVASASRPKQVRIQTPEREQEAQEPDIQSQDTQESPPPSKEPATTDAPPPKAEAFEAFKVGQGGELNHILKENKAVLLERHARLRQLTEEVNTAKRKIDRTTAAIERYKDKRARQGQFVSAKGEPVLGEPEISLVPHLRELKAQYRQRYEALRSTTAEVNYCQHLVDQCRVRLLNEFESWYKETFRVPEEVLNVPKPEDPVQPGIGALHKSIAQAEEDQELFERLQCERLGDSPRAISFYNARQRTQKRRNSRRLSLTPV